MALIKLTLQDNNGRIDVSAQHIESVYTTDGTTYLSLSSGADLAVTESARSVRGYIKKALTPVKKDLEF